MNWLRLYTTVLDNPKLQKLSGDHFKSLVNLWCLASIHNGTLPSVSDVAFRLRCTETQASELIDYLIDKKALDCTVDGIVPHDWNEHQYTSDSSTQRVQKHRKLKLEHDETSSETLTKRFSNVIEQNRTEQIQSRTEPPNPHAPEGACVNGVPTVKAMLPIIRKSRKGKRPTDEIRAALGEERGKWWDAFWDVFPCHDGMNEGMNAFEIRVRDHELAVQIWKGAKSYRAKCDADPTIKVKFAQGWINSERWLDENNLPAVMPRPQQKSFIDDVQRVIGERIANGEKPW